MATVFFKITDQQDKEIKSFMKEEGYANKAEFMRFLIKFFKYHKTPDEMRFEKAAQGLAEVLKKMNTKGMLGASIDDQLADV